MPYKNKEQHSAYQFARMNALRLKWLEENGPCSYCGSEEDLEVDHKNPKTKVSHRIWSWSAKRREEELSKCQVLCKTCHKVKSDNELRGPRVPLVHGTRSGYSKKCRCVACVKAHADAIREWKDRVGY